MVHGTVWSGMWVAIFGKLQNGATKQRGVNPENHNVSFHSSENSHKERSKQHVHIVCHSLYEFSNSSLFITCHILGPFISSDSKAVDLYWLSVPVIEK